MEILKLVKQSLSIADDSTIKDDELKMLINAGLEDMKRIGIDTNKMVNSDLLRFAVVMFVKSNFGFISNSDKEQALKSYNRACRQLSLSYEYKED